MARLTWFLPATMLIVIIRGMAVPKCGVPDVPPDQSEDFIVGGQPAKRYAWPWQVMVYKYYNYTWRVHCGGSIISEHWILTAEHCCLGYSASELQVVVGKYNLSANESTQKTYAVLDNVMYENDTTTPKLLASHDICLLKLDNDIEFSSSAMPVCLPDADAGPGNFYATGWGFRGHKEPRGGSDVLYQVVLPLYDQEKCNETFKEITPGMLCAGYDDEAKQPCFGDSGGPLVRKVGDQWKLFGITSWGSPTCSQQPPIIPAVFARVHYFIDWIKEHSGVTPPFDRP